MFAKVVVIVVGSLVGTQLALAEPAPKKNLAIVINGGVSLGAYQAGVTYTLMRYLKERKANRMPRCSSESTTERCVPVLDDVDGSVLGAGDIDLAIATGASAGNINAFLAALNWCDPSYFGPRSNLFHDTWMGVGLDKLSPSQKVRRSYADLFSGSNLDANLGPDEDGARGRTEDFPEQDLFKDEDGGKSVYRNNDGLLTRLAFTAAEENLRNRLGKTGYEACKVRVGITATHERPVPLGTARISKDIKTSRFVVPLQLTGGVDKKVRITNLSPNDWRETRAMDKSAGIGRSLLLPLRGDTVDPDDLLRLVKASSAFPAAFAPQTLPICVDGGGPGWTLNAEQTNNRTCPPGFTLRASRFIDGGIFDNIPLGLAQKLSTLEADGTNTYVDSPTYIYVDDSFRRHPAALPPVVRRSSGLSLLGGIMGSVVDEARNYELQGVARYLSDDIGFSQGRFFRSTRFMPLVGNYLVAFGSFLHPAFRRADYFIGLYDGIRTLSVPLEKQLGGTRKAFAVVRDLVIENDPELFEFITNLFEYEMYWAEPQSSSTKPYLCDAKSVHMRKSRTMRKTDDEDMWAVFSALCSIDEGQRRLERLGNYKKSQAYDRNEASFSGFIKLLDQYESKTKILTTDLNHYAATEVDRLLRRAVEIQKADERVLANRPKPKVGKFAAETVAEGTRKLLTVGRVAVASAIERNDETVDLDPSSVYRLSHGHSKAYRLLHLLPYYATWDFANSAFESGWEPKLRFGPRCFFALGASGKLMPWYFSERFRGRAAAGVGWDPRGRLFDDVSLLTTVYRGVSDESKLSVGLELTTIIATKFRLGIGLPRLIRGDLPEQEPDRRFETIMVSLGIADLNGLIAGSIQYLFSPVGKPIEEPTPDELDRIELGGGQ